MFSNGLLHMDTPELVYQQKLTVTSFVQTLILTKRSTNVVVGALCSAFLHCVWFESGTDECQSSLIRELMLYKFELGHNAMEATKNISVWKMKVQLITVQWPDG